MQLFMPYPDLYQSAAVLDPRRLGKQRLEAYECATQARKHPCATAWRGAELAAMHFARACCTRYGTHTKRDGTPYDTARMLGKVDDWLAHAGTGWTVPSWFGRPEVHTMYQRWLTRKDPAYYGPLFGVEPWPDDRFPWTMLVPDWVRR